MVQLLIIPPHPIGYIESRDPTADHPTPAASYWLPKICTVQSVHCTVHREQMQQGRGSDDAKNLI